MSKAKGHILPFFIPHLGCPHRCIFCDQQKISGVEKTPTAAEIWAEILAYYEKFGDKPELAFYGGSFAALSLEQQRYFLEPAHEGLQRGFLSGIRISTRPDSITPASLSFLQAYGVSTVELGVQSMVDEVLQKSGRGQTAQDSLKAVALLQALGLIAGVQLMPGLPLETVNSALRGANEILALRPNLARIYPTVVLKNTELATVFEQTTYSPLSLDEAAYVAMAIYLICGYYGVNVIRMGLQPTEELAKQVVCGPYHPAFGNLVQSRLWLEKVLLLLGDYPDALADAAIIWVNNEDVSKIVGQNKQNLAALQGYSPNLSKLKIKSCSLPKGELVIETFSGRRYGLSDEIFRRKYLANLSKRHGFNLIPLVE